MDLRNIISTGKNKYIIKTLNDLSVLTQFANVGSKALCLETNKSYVYFGKNEWIKI